MKRKRTIAEEIMLNNFKSFLTERRLLSKFERNIKRVYDMTFNKYMKEFKENLNFYPPDLITTAFTWAGIIDYYSFWNKIDEEWRNTCINIENKCKIFEVEFED